MIDHIVTLPLTRDTLTLVADPPRVHRLMAANLPDLDGRSNAIRADTDTQFRIDLPSDPLGTPGAVTMRLRGPMFDGNVGDATPTPNLSDGLRVVAVVAAEKRKTDDRGVRVRPVPDADVHAWAAALFQRHGLTATDAIISPPRRYGGRRGVRFTVRDLAAVVTINEPPAAANAMRRGIGRGRAYGLGMLVPIPRSDQESS